MFRLASALVGAMALATSVSTASVTGPDILDPLTIPKYSRAVVVPPAMPMSGETTIRGLGRADYYEIGVRELSQQVLPDGFPATTVWAYGSAADPGTFHWPAFTIEATSGRAVRVKWTNELTDAQGRFLPHLLPIDQTLHWANPGGPPNTSTLDPEPYRGPVPIVTHVHGGLTTDDSDGFTEAWYLPAAIDLGAYLPHSPAYDTFRRQFRARTGTDWAPGSAVFDYPNRQRAATIWYHDHALGMTRANVYAGLAGFYLVRGGPGDMVRARVGQAGMSPEAAARGFGDPLPGPAPRRGDAPGTRYYEIPLGIQDRSFKTDGSLFYPDSREYFDGFPGPYVPISDIAPIWNPEFFGNTMVVNGRVWPELAVEPRRYRFRVLNGCNSRTLIVKIVAGDPSMRPIEAAVPFGVIGNDQGFLPEPTMEDSLLLMPGERYDVVVDFTGLPVGSTVHMINEGPDEPFGGGEPGTAFDYADPATTGQVMRFRVAPLVAPDVSAPVESLVLPRVARLGRADVVRRLGLVELDSDVLPGIGPRMAVLATLDEEGHVAVKHWGDPVTEVIRKNDTEVWEIHNLTEDAHPIHLHAVAFEVLDRRPKDGLFADDLARGPESWERGYKDTVVSYPEEVLRVRARFEHDGLFVWHCHILEHEDHEMMRPMLVLPRGR